MSYCHNIPFQSSSGDTHRMQASGRYRHRRRKYTGWKTAKSVANHPLIFTFTKHFWIGAHAVVLLLAHSHLQGLPLCTDLSERSKTTTYEKRTANCLCMPLLAAFTNLQRPWSFSFGFIAWTLLSRILNQSQDRGIHIV